MPSEPTPQFIEGLYDAMRKRAADLAPKFGPGYGTKELTPEDMEVVWNRRKLTLEQEWELWRQTKADGTPLYTPAQIGLQVFPEREKFAKSGGRVEPKEWIPFANSFARRMEKKRAASAAVGFPGNDVRDNTGRDAELPGQGGVSNPAGGMPSPDQGGI